MKNIQERELTQAIEAGEERQRRDHTIKTILVSVASLLAILGLTSGGILIYQMMQSPQEDSALYPPSNLRNITFTNSSS